MVDDGCGRGEAGGLRGVAGGVAGGVGVGVCVCVCVWVRWDRFAHLEAPRFDLAIRGIHERRVQADSEALDQRREAWELLGPEGVAFPAVVPRQEGRADRSVRQEIRARPETELVRRDEVHGRCEVQFHDIDRLAGERARVDQGQQSVVQEDLGDGVHVRGGLQVGFRVDVGDHAFPDRMGFAGGGGEHVGHTTYRSEPAIPLPLRSGRKGWGGGGRVTHNCQRSRCTTNASRSLRCRWSGARRPRS